MIVVSGSNRPAESLRVVALQPSLRAGELDHNLDVVRRAVARLHDARPFDLLVLPECFNAVFDDGNGAMSRRTRESLSDLSGRFGIGVVGGSMERRAADGSLRNTTFVFDRTGRELGSYDKRVLFGREAKRRTAGDSAGIFEFLGWRVGVLICADLWHPELARQIHRDVDLLCVPAETTVPTRGYTVYARMLWHRLALIRAEENAVPVVVSDWAEGRLKREQSIVDDEEHADHFTSGGSSIADPSARPDVGRIQSTLEDGRPGELSATLEWERNRNFREYRSSVGLLPR